MTLISKVNLLIIMLIIFSFLLSCSKSNNINETGLDIIKVTGIYQSNIMHFAPGIKIQYFFGFNEINNSNINGGLRIIIIGNGTQPNKRVYKSKLIFEQWEELKDGSTKISAKCDFGNNQINDFGKVNCIGTIRDDSIFTFNIVSYPSHDYGTAVLVGDYISNLESDGAKYQGSYFVNYSESDSLFPNFCYPPNHCNQYDNTINILTVSLDGIGGLNIDGNFTGHIPIFGNDTTQFMDDSDIYGGNFYFGAYGWIFSIRGEKWWPGEHGIGNYRIKFFDDCQEINVMTGSLIINNSNAYK